MRVTAHMDPCFTLVSGWLIASFHFEGRRLLYFGSVDSNQEVVSKICALGKCRKWGVGSSLCNSPSVAKVGKYLCILIFTFLCVETGKTKDSELLAKAFSEFISC
jgi:hypothetical protein